MLPAVTDSLEKLPEAFREHYTKTADGSFAIAAEDMDTHPAIVAMKGQFEAAKREKTSLKADLAAAEAKAREVPEDFDAGEWERLRAEDAAGVYSNPDAEARVRAAVAVATELAERALARATDDHAATIAARMVTQGELEAELRLRVIHGDLRAALAAAGVTAPGIVKGAIALLQRDVEIDRDEYGQPLARMKAKRGGDLVEKFVRNWVGGDGGKAFADSIAPPRGVDSRGSGRRPGLDISNPFASSGWNVTAQGHVMRNDPERADRLARAAGFASLDAAKRSTRPH